jgi:L-fuculose-phosphate aldolase
MLILARSLGKINYFDEPKERELLALKQKWGYADPRNTKEYENCDICANDIFRETWKDAGVERRAFEAPPAKRPQLPTTAHEATASVAAGNIASLNGSPSSNGAPMKPTRSTTVENIDQEALIQAITDRVMAALGRQA